MSRCKAQKHQALKWLYHPPGATSFGNSAQKKNTSKMEKEKKKKFLRENLIKDKIHMVLKRIKPKEPKENLILYTRG